MKRAVDVSKSWLSDRSRSAVTGIAGVTSAAAIMGLLIVLLECLLPIRRRIIFNILTHLILKVT